MVQNSALRYYLRVHRVTPTQALHGEFGWKLPFHRHCINAVRYLNRLLTMEDNRITKHVFLWELNQCNKYSWTSQIKFLFESVISEHVYHRLLLFDIVEFERRL